jgi:hypothetical protein
MERRGGGRYELVGAICSAGFASGDRFVVGLWKDSPLGAMTDVMWARPDGERVLLAEVRPVADLITAIYRFDRVELVPIDSRFDGRQLELTAGSLSLAMQGGPGWRLPLGRVRPRWFTRWVEGAIARPLLGVRTFGVSPTQVRQWYRSEEYRPVVEARARVSGADLGALRPIDVPVRFGFTGPPRRPSMVRLHSLLEDRSARLEAVIRPDTQVGKRPG